MYLVEECGGTVVGEGVVLICDVLLVEECGGTVVGEGVVLICGVRLVFVGLLMCGLILWEVQLVPTFVVWVSWELGVWYLNTDLFSFLLKFIF